MLADLRAGFLSPFLSLPFGFLAAGTDFLGFFSTTLVSFLLLFLSSFLALAGALDLAGAALDGF